MSSEEPPGAGELLGALPPDVRTRPPGPRSRELSDRLARFEAPGVNTRYRGEPSIVWAEAAGSNVVDVDGNRYLDLTSGFGAAAVGHRHPRVVAAIGDQATRLLHGLGDVAAHPARVELARRLAEIAPIGDGDGAEAKVYPAVSGADAVEIAVKTAVLSTGRSRVLAFDPGYHGLTLGALAVTSRLEFRRPFEAHLAPVERLPFGAPLDEIQRHLAGREVAAVVVEPIVGREGVLLPPSGWLAEIAERARAAGTLVVADEIFTGFGRTGRRFVVEDEGVRPDLLCIGKALGGGLPLGAVVGRGELLDAWASPGEALHTATFIGHPLASAAALAVLDLSDQLDLPARARRLGETVVAPRLARWPERFGAVTATRGRGLLWGVELVDGPVSGRLVRELAGKGVLALAGGPAGRVLQIAPPLTMPEKLLALALDLVEEGLASIGR